MLLELDKCYRTADVRKAVVLHLNIPPAVPIERKFCVLLSVHDPYGKETFLRCDRQGFIIGFDRPFLLDAEPEWLSFAIDEPVMYQNARTLGWLRGHFAGVLTYSDNTRLPSVWNDCKTSWAGVSKVAVKDCRRPFFSEKFGGNT